MTVLLIPKASPRSSKFFANNSGRLLCDDCCTALLKSEDPSPRRLSMAARLRVDGLSRLRVITGDVTGSGLSRGICSRFLFSIAIEVPVWGLGAVLSAKACRKSNTE